MHQLWRKTRSNAVDVSALQTPSLSFASHFNCKGYVFMQEGASSYCFKATKKWPLEKYTTLLPWSTCYMDVYSIEKISTILVRRLYSHEK